MLLVILWMIMGVREEEFLVWVKVGDNVYLAEYYENNQLVMYFKLLILMKMRILIYQVW